MLQFFKISGDSLTPEYQDGDFVLALKIPVLFRYLRPGNRIVFQKRGIGTLIKKITAISAGGEEITVAGSHPDSIDSRDFGPIHRKDVTGLVVRHIPRPVK